MITTGRLLLKFIPAKSWQQTGSASGKFVCQIIAEKSMCIYTSCVTVNIEEKQAHDLSQGDSCALVFTHVEQPCRDAFRVICNAGTGSKI